MAVELTDREIRRHADAGLEASQRDLRLLRDAALRIVPGNERRHAGHRFRVHLRRVEHALGVLLTRQPRLRGARFILLRQRLLDARLREVVMVGRLDVPLHRVGIGDALQRRQIRHARHGHDVAGGRVVAEREERERASRAFARRDERGEGREEHAVQLASGHVARAGRVVVHRVVEAIQREQFLAELAKELLVAHASLLLLRCRRELVRALRQNVALFVEPVDVAHALGVHEIRRVPSARGIEDHVERPVVGRLLLRLRQERAHSAGTGKAQPGKAAEFEEVAAHGSTGARCAHPATLRWRGKVQRHFSHFTSPS